MSEQYISKEKLEKFAEERSIIASAANNVRVIVVSDLIAYMNSCRLSAPQVVGGELPNADGFSPCPFLSCKSADICIEYYTNDGQYYAAFCCNCGCQGPASSTPEEARQAWNTRPTATQGELVGILWRNNQMLHGALHGISYGLGKDKDYACKRLEESKRVLDGAKERVEAALSASPVTGWMPIEHWKPEKGSWMIHRPRMLVKVSEAFYEAGRFYDSEGIPFGLIKPGSPENVTHVMAKPLPPQPSAAEEGEGKQ